MNDDPKDAGSVGKELISGTDVLRGDRVLNEMHVGANKKTKDNWRDVPPEASLR